MTYNKTAWKSGDIISSEKLNNMQNGIEQGCLFEHKITNPQSGQILKYDDTITPPKWVNADNDASTIDTYIISEDSQYRLNKTWQELYDIMPANIKIFRNIYEDTDTNKQIGSIYEVFKTKNYDDIDKYYVYIYFGDNLGEYAANTANDYPQLTK